MRACDCATAILISKITSTKGIEHFVMSRSLSVGLVVSDPFEIPEMRSELARLMDGSLRVAHDCILVSWSA